MFQTVKKQSVSDQVFNQICSRIVSRELQAGEELPSERILSEMLGVSRNAVREAIKRLQQARLVEVKQGGLSTVLDFWSEAGADLLPQLIFDAQSRVQVDVVRNVVRMRQVLSPEIAADAAVFDAQNTAQRLDLITEQMVKLSAEKKPSCFENAQLEQQQLAWQFWEVLVDGCGNIAYRLAFNSLRKTYQPLLALMTPILAPQQQNIDTFQQLASLIRQGKRDAAADCAREYIDASSQAIYHFLDQYQEQSHNNKTRE